MSVVEPPPALLLRMLENRATAATVRPAPRSARVRGPPTCAAREPPLPPPAHGAGGCCGVVISQAPDRALPLQPRGEDPAGRVTHGALDETGRDGCRAAVAVRHAAAERHVEPGEV